MTVPLYWRDQSLMDWTDTLLASSSSAKVGSPSPPTSPTRQPGRPRATRPGRARRSHVRVNIADIIAFTLSRPRRLAINEVLLRPAGQL
jgi:hypothetical protein